MRFFTKSYNEAVFESWFGFKPYRLAETRYRKEVMLRMAILAKAAIEEGKSYVERPTNQYRAENYFRAFNNYNNAFNIVRLYDADFAAQMPHWTEFPNFLQDWLRGEPLGEESGPRSSRPTLSLISNK